MPSRDRPHGDDATVAVFEALTDFAFLTPHCHPSEDLLAERIGCSRRTVTRAKRALKAAGWISWKRRRKLGARWEHCVYTLHRGWRRPHRKVVCEWLRRRHVSLREHLSGGNQERKKQGTTVTDLLGFPIAREAESKQRGRPNRAPPVPTLVLNAWGESIEF